MSGPVENGEGASPSPESILHADLRSRTIDLFNSRPIKVTVDSSDFYSLDDAANDAIKYVKETGVTEHAIFTALTLHCGMRPAEVFDGGIEFEENNSWEELISDMNRMILTESLNNSEVAKEDDKRYRFKELFDELYKDNNKLDDNEHIEALRTQRFNVAIPKESAGEPLSSVQISNPQNITDPEN